MGGMARLDSFASTGAREVARAGLERCTWHCSRTFVAQRIRVEGRQEGVEQARLPQDVGQSEERWWSSRAHFLQFQRPGCRSEFLARCILQ